MGQPKNTGKVTAEEAATILQTDVQMIYRLKRRGLLTVYKKPFGRPREFFDRAQVEQLLRQSLFLESTQ